MALMTYGSKRFEAGLPTLTVSNGEVVSGDSRPFSADQRFQIAVLTDFCNECGNCTTFCPTSGDPYKDKPRLYLDREDFEAQSDNAFMLIEEGDAQVMEARWAGETHRLELNGRIQYRSPALEATIDPADFSLIEARPGASAEEGREVSLEACASMFVLLEGLAESMPHLPWAGPGGKTTGTRVAHPGYDE
jgi:putative selenate reductase